MASRWKWVFVLSAFLLLQRVSYCWRWLCARHSYFTFSLAVKKDEVITVLEWQLRLWGRGRKLCTAAYAKAPTWGTSRQNVKRRHKSFTLTLLIIQQLFCANTHEDKYSNNYSCSGAKVADQLPWNVLHGWSIIEAETNSVVLWNTSLFDLLLYSKVICPCPTGDMILSRTRLQT